MFCTKCGSKLDVPGKFCSKCGAKVYYPVQIPQKQTYQTAAAPAPAPAPAPIRSQPQKSNALPVILIAGGVLAAGLVLVAIIIAVIFSGRFISDTDSYSGTEYNQEIQYDNNDIFTEDPFTFDEYDAEYPADDYVITDQQDTCISCYGSGYCDDCNGTGQYSMYGNPLDTCPSCDGDGICSICDGLGYY